MGNKNVITREEVEELREIWGMDYAAYYDSLNDGEESLTFFEYLQCIGVVPLTATLAE